MTPHNPMHGVIAPHTISVTTPRRRSRAVRAAVALVGISALTAFTFYTWAPVTSSYQDPGQLLVRRDISSPDTSSSGSINGSIPLITSKHGVVASENLICSEIGAQILREKGSAVDAVVATTLCIGVTNMYSSGIGGGGFMVVRGADLSEDDGSDNGFHLSPGTEFIDFREKAPKASSVDMFVGKPGASQVGGLAVGVPGELRGLELAHKKYGRLSWKRVVEPAMRVARDGWKVTPTLADRIISSATWILQDPAFAAVFAPNGTLLQVNDTIRRVAYADTLETISKYGVDVFYKGAIGDSIIKTVTASGGIMTHDDLASYRAESMPALTGTYRGRTVHTAPPPASGPVLLSVLNMMEWYDYEVSNLSIHRLIETWKFGYAQRTYYGDPTDPVYTNITDIYKTNIRKDVAAYLRDRISDTQTFDPQYYDLEHDVLNDSGTMHVSVLSADGSAVALTSTVNLKFGAKLMDPQTGIIFNDQMDDFSTPGASNAFGYAPSPYNYVRPGKRPLSSCVPTIIEGLDGRVDFVAGASGGSRIITSTLQVLLGMMDLGDDPAKAILRPRAHHQLIPNIVVLENEFDRDIAASLVQKGHNVTFDPAGVYATGVQAVKRVGRMIQGASDVRKGGIAAGV